MAPVQSTSSWKNGAIGFFIGAVFMLVLLMILANTLPRSKTAPPPSPATR